MSLFSKIASSTDDPTNIQFVGSTTNTFGSGTTLNLSKPTRVVEGDLLLAFFSVDQNVSLTTTANGWVTVVGGGPYSVLAKIAEASEPSSWNFTNSISAYSSGAMLAFRNATFDTYGTDSTWAYAINPIANAVSVSADGSVVLGFFSSFASSVSFSTPSGFSTLAADNNYNTPSWAVFVKYGVAAGTAPAATSNSGLSYANARGAQIVLKKSLYKKITFVGSSVNNTNGTTLNVLTPTGTAEGDLMVAFAVHAASSGGWATTSGWTQAQALSGQPPNLMISYRVAGASEPSTQTFTNYASGLMSCGIVTYRNAQFDSASGFTSGAVNLDIYTSVATAGFARVIGAVGKTGTNGTVPTSNFANSRVIFSSSTCLGVFDEIKPSSSPTTKRLSASTTATAHTAGSVTIKPT